ncbi:PH domain-containing protein [Leucobacter salsicius]|uniref:PH domain-containing protein n=1 Tax=Leucobacter salsicius TaxID=664638 RepID=UPI0003472515|nr:PH domain-containing protein [Leucobacter salsicius]
MAQRRHLSVTAEVESVLGPPPAQLSEPEVIVLRIRPHARRLLLPIFASCAVAAAAGFWVGALPADWMNVLAGVGALVLAAVVGLLPLLSWLTQRTVITSRRVIVRRGLFVRHRSEVQLSRVREVRMRRKLLQRLWGASDIALMFGAEDVTLHDVPGAEVVAEALHDLMERNYAHATRSQGFFSPTPQDLGS